MMSVVEATAFTFSYCLSFLGPVSTIITAVYIGEELTVSKVKIVKHLQTFFVKDSLSQLSKQALMAHNTFSFIV